MLEINAEGLEEQNPEKFEIDSESMPSDILNEVDYKKDFEMELLADKSCCGRVIYVFYKFWEFLLMFEVFVKVICAYSISAISQLLFVQSSSNPEQGVLVGFVTFCACYLATTVLYFLFYLCWAEVDKNTKKKVLKIEHPARIIYFLILCSLLGVSLYSIYLIHHNCFDEDGNYVQPVILDDNSTLIFCDVKSIVLG